MGFFGKAGHVKKSILIQSAQAAVLVHLAGVIVTILALKVISVVVRP